MSFKFALRDDDLNYFYKPEIIEMNFNDIWDICPVSMSVVPYIKGNWIDNTKMLESIGPGIIDNNLLEILKNDDEIFPIDENIELVKYIKTKLKEERVYLTFHSIHHRNEDPIIPQFENNYGFGAEFYTTRDLTDTLRDSIKYVEDVFGQKIEVFTPPQNLYSMKGLEAIINNNLAICGDLPKFKSLNTLKLFGIKNYLNYFVFKLHNPSTIYPKPLVNKMFKIVAHQRLQPGTDLNSLYAALDFAYEYNGVFILSTHSYAFNTKMKNSNNTMKNELNKILSYAQSRKQVSFVKLNEIFV